MKRTKIVATIGPVSESKEVLREMILAGMNVVRLNFSHNEYSWHKKIIDTVRELSAEMDVPVGILADLQGPRIRTIVEMDTEIKSGDVVLLFDTSKDIKSEILNAKSEINSKFKIQNSKFIGLDVKNIVDDIGIGNEILIEDGLMRLTVREKNGGVLLCEVIDGGTVKNHKGVNIPDAKLNIDVVTPKDIKDLEFSIKNDVDFVALSFVSTGQEIEGLRQRIKELLPAGGILPQIVAKVERKEAIRNLDEIIGATDIVMVARGDLGIEMETSRVAVLQKEIIAKSLKNAKPVIVATQMLNSMIDNPRPTRAEVSDVSNAVIDHADAVMLSGETANGKYPVETVRIMAEIIRNTEESPFDDVVESLGTVVNSEYVAIAKSANDLARSYEAEGILMASLTGFTARLMSHFRPEKKLLVATSLQKTYYQLSMVWGVVPYWIEAKTVDESIETMIEKALKDGRLKKDDKAVIMLGRKAAQDKEMHLMGVRTIGQ